MKIAIVFPGQGSQKQGMMQGFAGSPVVRGFVPMDWPEAAAHSAFVAHR